MTTQENQAQRVLVIDDDPPLLRLLSLCMRDAGLSVATADDGVSGLDALENAQFDVIVLDLQMPRMDGRTFYREMESRGLQTPVVILSAYGAEAAQRELGAAASLPKPFDPDVLVDTVLRVAKSHGE